MYKKHKKALSDINRKLLYVQDELALLSDEVAEPEGGNVFERIEDMIDKIMLVRHDLYEMTEE